MGKTEYKCRFNYSFVLLGQTAEAVVVAMVAATNSI
jgi:hypothetical protein